jgi:hypothetical protein
MVSATDQTTIHARMKQANLASAVGAGVLGGGIGVLLAQYIGPYAVPLVVVGIVMHVWGMLENRRLEAVAPRVWWAEALYWLC